MSIGLPVFNGENYVAAAIESLLRQTFEDFELIISDNASTDRTHQICNAYAASDPRIRYIRNRRNLGPSANYIRLVAEARGEYFKWAAHDDVCHQDFVRACVEVLERDPSVVACYPRTVTINHEGRPIKTWPPRRALGAPEPHVRLREALIETETHPIWGLMRTDTLRQTGLLGNYPAHDMPFLAELCLHGQLHEIPEPLFYQREHGGRSVRRYDFQDPYQIILWYDPSKKGKLVFLHWRLLREYLSALHRAPLNRAERWQCLREIGRWGRGMRGALVNDLMQAAVRLPGVGRVVRPAVVGVSALVKARQWRRMARRVAAVTEPSDVLLLVGDCWFRKELLGRRSLPFLEKDGQYYGAPADDESAVKELERMRADGASHLVFAQPAFWWLEYYTGLASHLQERYRSVLQDPVLVVYDLREPDPHLEWESRSGNT